MCRYRWNQKDSISEGMYSMILHFMRILSSILICIFPQGNDDLRQDAVMQQVFGIMNSLLQTSKDTKSRRLSIRTYKVSETRLSFSLEMSHIYPALLSFLFRLCLYLKDVVSWNGVKTLHPCNQFYMMYIIDTVEKIGEV